MDIFVKGVGRTKFGAFATSLRTLLVECADRTIEDAGIPKKDIDAIFVSNFVGGVQNRQLHLGPVTATAIGLEGVPALRIEAACASGGAAFWNAVHSRAWKKNALVIGVEHLWGSQDALTTTRSISLAGDAELDIPEAIFPAQYALIADAYMTEHGSELTRNALDRISLKNHANANENPLAHFYGKKVTLETIQKSDYVSTPLRLFDCSPISNGAAAVILSREKDENNVEVKSTVLTTDATSLTQRRQITSFQAVKNAAAQAFKQAELGTQDIGVCEVHDCFTIAELIALEDLGFCPRGAASEFVLEGNTELHGKLPVNTDGGLKADGHPIGASGLGQIVEVVHQLRRTAGKRQVPCDYGLTHNVGGVGGTAVISIFGA